LAGDAPTPPPVKEEAPAPVAEEPKVEEAPAAETPVVEEAPAPVVEETPTAEATAEDDLKKIEGVGPKIESLLKEGGLKTFAQVAASAPEAIKEILVAAGSRYQMHDPTSWPLQAGMAAEGKWEELDKWQDEHKGGKM